MRIPYLHSISLRVTFWLSLVVVAIVSLHLYLMRPEKRFYEQRNRELERMAHFIETHLLAEMASGEPDNIQKHMELLPERGGIYRVEVVDPSMVVRFSSEPSRLGRTLDRSEESCRHCHVEGTNERPERLVYDVEGVGRVFAIDHVLRNKPSCRPCHAADGPILGNMLVELSLSEHDLAMLEARRRLVVVGITLLVVLIVGTAAIIRFLVGRPVKSLLQKMGRIEAGRFDVGPPSSSRDEFGYLENGFGQMVDKLRELYNTMDAKIKERTESLYETQAQVMHQEKLAGIGQLAAGVAHEIGNPLTAIDSTAQLLAMENQDPGVQEKVKTIQQQVDRMSDIVHGMADLSRPLSVGVDYVNVNHVIRAVLGLVKYDARFRKIDVRVHLDEGLPCVRTVEDRLFGAFLNLAINAADAMPDGGVLEITAAIEGSEVVVRFSDTGQGIAQENIGRVFEPYFTTKGPGGGTGLGLSVCKTYFRDMGGDIEVESQIGIGTTFRARIPLEREASRREAS